MCEHNLTEIRDRRLLRHVEKDLKKVTAKAKKERNDEVRALVAFVKKRDRRVIEHRRVLEDRAELNRAKQTEKRMEQLRKNREEVEEAMRQQKANGMGGEMQADYEKQLKRMERAYGSDSCSEEESEEDEDLDEISEKMGNGAAIKDDNGEEFEEEYIDHLYCVACNKSFKNDSSMRNHESSKKHRDNLDRIRAEMLADEEANAASNSDVEEEDEAEDEADEIIDSNADEPEDLIQTVETDIADNENEADEDVLTTIPTSKQCTLSKKARRRAQKKAASHVISDDPIIITEDPIQEPIDGEEPVSSKSTKKSRRKSKQVQPISTETVSTTPKPILKQNGIKSNNHDENESDSDDSLDRWTDRKEKRANAKKAKATKPKKPLIEDLDSIDVDHTCVTCAAIFDSKNKLFAHLKSANHGVYIEGKGVTMSREVLEAAAAAQFSLGKGKKTRRKM